MQLRRYEHSALLMFLLVMLLFQLPVLETAAQSADQGFITRKFTTENGLSHDYVHWITQDKTGFLWIATWDGVSRFDGYEFKNYYHQPGEINSLPFFAVDKVLNDNLNNVWILSQQRPLVRYDRTSDRFVREYFNTFDDTTLTDVVTGRGNNLWLATHQAIYRYDPVSFKSTRFTLQYNNEVAPNHSSLDFQIVRDNKEGIWLINIDTPDDVVYRVYKAEFVNDSSFLLESYSTIPISDFGSFGIRNPIGNFDVYISGKGNTWFFCKYGLYKLDQGNMRFERFNGILNPEEFSGKSFFSWTDDKAGLHLISTNEGKYVNIPSTSGHYVTSVFLDKSQTIWSGEVDEFRDNIGLKRFTTSPDQFSHFLTETDEAGRNQLIFPIVEGPDGEIWIGTRHSDNLFRISKDGRVTKQKFIEKYKGVHPRIRSMVRDSSGIWMGCTGNYVIRYDFLSESFTSYYLQRKTSDGSDSDLAVHNILPDGNKLLISGWEGIYQFYPQDGKVELRYKTARSGSVFCFVKDGKEGYWLGMNGNFLTHLDKSLKSDGAYRLGSEFNNVEHILPGDSSDVWVALMGGGLAHFFPETSDLRIYTTADGLVNNTLYSLLKDTKGNIWISTNTGLSRFNPRTGIFRNFTKTEGLKIREFNSDSWGRAADGRLFFGGVGGLVSFYPDSIGEQSGLEEQNPLIITDVFVSGIPRYFEKAVYEMDTVVLSKGDNNFQLRFACLDFLNPEKIRYRYRLSGVNEKWTETDYRNRVVNYAGLSPGSYRFELESTNYNGEWIANTSLTLVIPHFCYQTGWFRLMALFLGVSLIILIIVLYVRQIKLKAKQKEAELRLESLRGQMNPHFIFNSLNSINYFISGNDKLMANQYIADFSRLIRSILQNHSSEYIPLEKELESLQDYLKLEYLRFGDKFNYSLDIEGVRALKQILVFPGMVQPFVENAIWHGVRGLEDRIGFVRIAFHSADKHAVKCIVEDDGVGRKLAESFKSSIPGKKSRGIGIVMERLRIINDLEKTNFRVTVEDLFHDKQETGTRVIIDIPAKPG